MKLNEPEADIIIYFFHAYKKAAKHHSAEWISQVIIVKIL